MVSHNHSVKENRLAVLEEIEEVLEDIEHDVKGRFSRIRQNLNIAEDNLLVDGEYNHCVRFALHQMSREVMKYEEIPSERAESINDLREGLKQKAMLPPTEQITR